MHFKSSGSVLYKYLEREELLFQPIRAGKGMRNVAALFDQPLLN